MSSTGRNKERLYQDLKRRILTLELAPGADVDEVALSTEYGISRTPLREVLRNLAGEGYLALAVDLYGGRSADDRDGAMALMREAMADREAALSNLRDALDWLDERGQGVGVIGWCFGGAWSLQSAIHFALIKSRGELIRAEHLPPDVQQSAATIERPAATVPLLDAPPTSQPKRKGRAPKLTHPAVEAAIAEARGNKVKAAKLLGVGRATLYRYLKKNPL